MVDNWNEARVEAIAASIPNALATGPFGSSISSRFFQDYGVPVIRGSNLSENVGQRLIHDNMVFVSEEKARDFSRSLVRKGDLIFTCWGTIGQVGLIDSRCPYLEYVISNKQMKFTPDPDKADSLFLYYLFSGPEMSFRIRNDAIGSSVPGYNLGQLRALRLLLPSLPEQRAIAHILGTLDDKIELNRRTNETLEAMARAIFTSWFVDFDPVRAKTEGRPSSGMDAATAALFPAAFEDSALGEIPQGWNVGQIGDVANNPRRGIDPSDLVESTPYIGLEHMPRKSIALSEWENSDGVESNKYAFEEGDILFGKLRPYFHKVGVAPVNGICSTDILVITPKQDFWFAFVLEHVSSDDFIRYTDANSAGTKMPRTNWNDMTRYKIAMPDEKVAAALDQHIRPMTESMRANIHQSRTLAAIRDALLPKLLSGEIRVRDAEKIVAEQV